MFAAAWCALLLTPAVQGQDPGPADFYCDFRTQPLPAEVSLHNDPDGTLCRFEPEGLRITVPRTMIHQAGGVGIRTSFELHGDFDVTTTIQLLQLDQPSTGTGAGITLYLPTVAGGEGAFMGRMLGVKGKQILLCSQQFAGPKGSIWQQTPIPCEHDLLRVRLQRTGTTLSYHFASGISGGEFQQVHQAEFNADRIQRVRLTAANNLTHCAMDVRLIDLRIRGGVPKAEPVPAVPDAAPARPRRWLLILMSLALGVALAATAWLYWQRSRRADAQREQPA